MWPVLGIVIVIILLDVLFLIEFAGWQARRFPGVTCADCREYVLDYCVTIDYDKRKLTPLCQKCCDHTHEPKGKKS